MNVNIIKHLDWDTSFFGYKVAQVIFDQSGSDYLKSIIRQLKIDGIHLTYFYVPQNDHYLNNDIEKCGGVLVDRKALFIKTPEHHSKFNNKVIEFSKREPDDRLLALALNAGRYSRFKLDKNFHNHEFEKLYTEWLLKSLDKTIASRVLVVNSVDSVVGLTTLMENDNNACIGLVSVDDNYSGMGIATDLIHHVDNIAYENKYATIKVVTQQQNSRAFRLYERCGFLVDDITNIYHFWQ